MQVGYEKIAIFDKYHALSRKLIIQDMAMGAITQAFELYHF